LSQTFDQICTVCGAIGAVLLKFDYVLTEQPVSNNKMGVHNPERAREEFHMGAVAEINKLVEIHGAQGKSGMRAKNSCRFAPGQHHIGDLTEMILHTMVAVEKEVMRAESTA
jgi:hypothetical protein